jgi:hypothetical protein
MSRHLLSFKRTIEHGNATVIGLEAREQEKQRVASAGRLLRPLVEPQESSMECTEVGTLIHSCLDSVRHHGQYQEVCDVHEIVFLWCSSLTAAGALRAHAP